VQRAYVQACLVDRAALAEHQERNDAVLALATLKQAFTTDVAPILAMARHARGGAINPVAVYRASRYRQQLAKGRPADTRRGGGIV
jgi:L-rhamnose isomerase/sugar isomerase